MQNNDNKQLKRLTDFVKSMEFLEEYNKLSKIPKLKVLVEKNQNELFAIQGGFVEVLNNKVTVLVEGSKPVE